MTGPTARARRQAVGVRTDDPDAPSDQPVNAPPRIEPPYSAKGMGQILAFGVGDKPYGGIDAAQLPFASADQRSQVLVDDVHQVMAKRLGGGGGKPGEFLDPVGRPDLDRVPD